MTFHLRCHLCQKPFPAGPLWVCDKCLGPLEVVFNYDAIKPTLSRQLIESRPKNLWRYRELLPIDGEPRTGLHSGFTPLVKADRLAARLGVRELYVKDGSVNHPTCSYKDRVVSVAATRAVELGFTMFACASTGNLARRAPRAVVRGVHSRRSRAGQGRRRRCLPPAYHLGARQLRRCEPVVHAG